jgi:type II secretory pathway pseudopilin PulG
MKFSPSIKKRNTKGFGLLEVILVFAIVIGAAAVVFTVFQSAKPSADASNEASNLSTIATNLKSTFGINHDYSGVTNTTAIAAKAIPTSMVSGTAGVQSEWGPVTLTGVAQTATTPSTYNIVYADVPSDTCAKFVTGVSGFFPNITVGTGTADVVAGVVNSTNIITDCGAASTVSITFSGS